MAKHRFEIAEVDRHIEVVSREPFRCNRDRSMPRMAVYKPTLTRILQLPVCRVKIAMGDELFHGELPDGIALRFDDSVTA
jgi:hypothetical protein